MATPRSAATSPSATTTVRGLAGTTGAGGVGLLLSGARQTTAGALPTATAGKAGPLSRLTAGRSVSPRTGVRLGARGINHPAASFLGNGTIARFIRFIPTWIWINSKVPPFDNPKVRQALLYAVDVEKIQKLLTGVGGPLYGII